jgi:hypothetical protein
VPDQLEELFADLRADTLPRVRPPGTQAARHTVRRRRTTRTVATAAVVLAAAGGLIASNLQLAKERQAPPAERQNNPVDTAKRALDTQLPRLAGRPMTGTGSRAATRWR